MKFHNGSWWYKFVLYQFGAAYMSTFIIISIIVSLKNIKNLIRFNYWWLILHQNGDSSTSDNPIQLAAQGKTYCGSSASIGWFTRLDDYAYHCLWKIPSNQSRYQRIVFCSNAAEGSCSKQKSYEYNFSESKSNLYSNI